MRREGDGDGGVLGVSVMGGVLAELGGIWGRIGCGY